MHVSKWEKLSGKALCRTYINKLCGLIHRGYLTFCKEKAIQTDQWSHRMGLYRGIKNGIEMFELGQLHRLSLFSIRMQINLLKTVATLAHTAKSQASWEERAGQPPLFQSRFCCLHQQESPFSLWPCLMTSLQLSPFGDTNLSNL